MTATTPPKDEDNGGVGVRDKEGINGEDRRQDRAAEAAASVEGANGKSLQRQGVVNVRACLRPCHMTIPLCNKF